MKKVIVQNTLIFSEVANLVSEGGSVTLKTKGNSMLPFIRGGQNSVILVKSDEIKLYDIVLAEVSNNHYVLHRVIDINGNQLTLMGDGNLKGCEKCSTENVIATAVEVVGNGKRYYCRNEQHIREAKIWKKLLPLRRFLLAIYKLTCRI